MAAKHVLAVVCGQAKDTLQTEDIENLYRAVLTELGLTDDALEFAKLDRK